MTRKSARAQGLLWHSQMRSMTPALLLSDASLVGSPLLSSLPSSVTPIAAQLC